MEDGLLNTYVTLGTVFDLLILDTFAFEAKAKFEIRYFL